MYMDIYFVQIKALSFKFDDDEENEEDDEIINNNDNKNNSNNKTDDESNDSNIETANIQNEKVNKNFINY